MMYVYYAIKDGEKYYRRGGRQPLYTYDLHGARLYLHRQNAENKMNELGSGKVVRIHAKLREL